MRMTNSRLSDDLDIYIRFRSGKEAVEYDLGSDFFYAWLIRPTKKITWVPRPRLALGFMLSTAASMARPLTVAVFN
jgi:hypothetical protein